MDIEAIRSILYKPYFHIPKNYHTEKNFYPTLPTIEQESSEKKEPTALDEIESIENLIPFIPGKMQDSVKSILNLVYFFLVLVEKINPDKGKETIIITKPDPPNPIPPYYKLIFPDKMEPNRVITHVPNEALKIECDYAKNVLDVSTYYLKKLKEILAHFLYKIIADPQIAPFVSEYTLNGHPLTKEEHLLFQNFLKTNQQKQSQIRLYNKLFNERESITLLKSIEYSKTSLLRNVQETFEDATLYLHHKQILMQEKNVFDKKQYEYYRYLNGSLSLLEECLDLQLKESTLAKTIEAIKKEKQ